MKKNHESHTFIFKIRRTSQENQDTFFKTKIKPGAISQTEISHGEREFTVDSGTSVHMMSKDDHIFL